ncbi:MAG: hypothetical protein K2K80_01045 [Clostridia bacterium]|nr:hypothetical protein [Clostridia bacterium]
MDRICVAVLDKINSLASAGRYVVFSEEELKEALPENADGDIKQTLKALCDGGYIDVKYSSGNMYCIAPLKSYVEETPPPPAEEPEKAVEEIKKTPFWAAFAGGAAGSFIISLIFTILWYVG